MSCSLLLEVVAPYHHLLAAQKRRNWTLLDRTESSYSIQNNIQWHLSLHRLCVPCPGASAPARDTVGVDSSPSVTSLCTWDPHGKKLFHLFSLLSCRARLHVFTDSCSPSLLIWLLLLWFKQTWWSTRARGAKAAGVVEMCKRGDVRPQLFSYETMRAEYTI